MSQNEMKEIDFSEYHGKFCFLVNLSSYLKYNGIDCNEINLGGLLSYYGFSFCDYHSTHGEEISGRGASLEELFFRFLRLTRNIMGTVELDDNENLISSLKDVLEERKAVLAWMDHFYFSHSQYFQRAHYHSIVIVIAVSDETVIFFDNGIHKIKTADFRRSLFIYKKLILYYITGNDITFDNDDHWCSAINEMCKQMLSISYHEINRHNDIKMGLVGLNHFYKRLSTEEDVNYLYNIYFQLSRPGGIIVSRKQLYEFCSLHRDKLCHEAQVLKICDELTTDWLIFTNLIFKLSRFYTTDLKTRIIIRLDDLIQSEERLFSLIRIRSDSTDKGDCK